MDITQMYNQSAMLRDTFLEKANMTNDEKERNKFHQLALDQQNISERLRKENDVQGYYNDEYYFSP